MPDPGPRTSPDLGSQSPRVDLQHRATEFCLSQVQPGSGVEGDRRGDAVTDPRLPPPADPPLPQLVRSLRVTRDLASGVSQVPGLHPQAPPRRARPAPPHACGLTLWPTPWRCGILCSGSYPGSRCSC